MHDHRLLLEPAAARELLLVRAIEEADPQGRLVGAADREEAELKALERQQVFDPLHYLRERARHLLAVVESRQPRLAALDAGEPWRGWPQWALPLAACIVGAALDRIDNPRQVNMLSPPLLAVLLWNLAVYVALLARRWIPRGRSVGDGSALQRRLAGIRVGAGRTGNLRADATQAFRRHWWTATGAQQSHGWQQLLHATAAGWAVGLAISIVIGGLVREYRVGWESTLLDLDQVHAFLAVLFAPVVALLPFDSFSAAELARMRFGSGAQVGVAEARHWLWMYLALLTLVVIVPRALLASGSWWRRRRGGASVQVDLAEPYYAQLLAGARTAQSIRLLARQLLQAARATEPVAGGALTFKQLLDPARREAMQQARQLAVDALLSRLRAGQEQTLRGWVELHAVTASRGSALQVPVDAADLRLQQAVDSPQASMAGAATGAAMGAGIDLMTGGLTLGAAAALGALVGGAAAFTAAHRKNRSAPGGAAQVQADDEVLQKLVEAGLATYLAVVHGRKTEQAAVSAATDAARPRLEPIWAKARESGESAGLERELAAELRAALRQLAPLPGG